MMHIACPSCGPRNENEFTWGGQGHLVRPDPATCSDEAWTDYLFMRANPRGLHRERWCHTYGCGQWFHLARDTLTHRVAQVYGIDEEPRDGG